MQTEYLKVSTDNILELTSNVCKVSSQKKQLSFYTSSKGLKNVKREGKEFLKILFTRVLNFANI